MPNTVVEIEFPLGGINRSMPYQAEPPKTTPDAENVRPYDPEETRLRGGTRPGLDRFVTGAVGSPVIMMQSVGWVSGTTQEETLVYAAGGNIYYYGGDGPSGTPTLSTGGCGGQVEAAEMLQKLYINSAGTINVFDPASPTAQTALTASAGAIPTGTTLIASYRDRLVLAGPDHSWYMSRQQDPTDWNYGADADDGGRAVAATVSDAGLMGNPITAVIPLSNEYLLFACQNSLWRLSGDPTWGGRQDCVSRTTGIVGPHAWVLGPSGELYFLARNGLQMLYGPEPPVPLSADTIPAALRQVDAGDNYVTMGYDRIGRGVNIFITPNAGTTAGDHWFYHIPTKSWWRETYQNGHQPTRVCDYAPWAGRCGSRSWGRSTAISATTTQRRQAMTAVIRLPATSISDLSCRATTSTPTAC